MHEWLRTAVLAVIGLSACTGGAPAAADAPAPAAVAAAPAAGAPAVAGAVSPEAKAEAAQIFQSRCFACHGATGAGDGPASKGLTPQPRNFHDPAWQAGVTDQHIETIIKFGGAAVGKSPAMPPNPDLTSKADVVAALRQHIRDLKD